MAFKIKVKRNSSAPATGALDAGEFGYNTSTTIPYIGNGAGNAATEIISNSSTAQTKVGAFTTQGKLGGEFLELETLTGTSPTTGQLTYDTDAGSFRAGLFGNYVLELGEKSVYFIENVTGSTIPKGSIVGFAGAAGDHLRGELFLANSAANPNYIMGVADQSIANTAFGFVVHFGKIRSIDTSAYTPGTILYASASSAGAFTSTEPASPNLRIPVGAVVKQNASSGIIQTRIKTGERLGNIHDVAISSPADGHVLIYDNAQARWENNTLTAGGAITITNAAGAVTIAHTDTSSQSSVSNTGVSYIQDATLDTYGHVTALTSSTIRDASAILSGLVNTSAQTFAGIKTFDSTISGSVDGNAGTATTLQTSRLFTITDNDATNSQAAATSFNGGAAYTLKLPATIKATLTGNASTVTTSADNSTDATRYVLFANAVSGSQEPKTDTGLTFNPSTDNLSVGSGSLSWTLDGSSASSFVLRDSTGTAELTVSNAGLVTATTFSGSGASLTSLNAGNISSGTLVVGRGGTGTATAPTQWGVIYASTTSAYASTAAGTAGQFLKSNASSAPTYSYLGNGLTSLVNVSATANTYTTAIDTGSLAVGTYIVDFTGAYAKSNATSASLIFSARLGATNGRITGSGFYAVTDDTTTFTNFFINHASATDAATGTGFTTSAIAATRSFTVIQFRALLRISVATNLLIRIASNTASSGFSLNDGSGLTVIRVA
jgi:hypothetical protein